MVRGLKNAFVFALLVLATATVSFAQQWVEARPPGGNYRVEFPSQPKIYNEPVTLDGGENVVQYFADWESPDKSAYLAVAHVDYRAAPSIDDAIKGNASGVNGTIRSDVAVSVGNVPARKVIVDVPQSRIVLTQIFLVVGNRLYQVSATGMAGFENSETAQRFLASFALVTQ